MLSVADWRRRDWLTESGGRERCQCRPALLALEDWDLINHVVCTSVTDVWTLLVKVVDSGTHLRWCGCTATLMHLKQALHPCGYARHAHQLPLATLVVVQHGEAV